jgi:REP element-mobilizing transposase RayT
MVNELRAKRFASEGGKFMAFEERLDFAAFGPTWLRSPHIAQTVVQAIIDSDQSKLCKLHAYVVMPNHVHVLLAPLAQLRSITQFIKGRSARQANLALHRQGKTFWQKESFDHWVRDSAEFDRILRYIRNNPVKARLVTNPDAWPWLMPKNEAYSLNV